MNILQDIAALNRPAFFDGQRLAATDLQAVEKLNREMRWLHNQSLHQPGIGNGYAITGHKGDSQVTIGPGYALDCIGREIVLTSPYLQTVPSVAGEPNGTPSAYYLTAAYPPDPLTALENRQGNCPGCGEGAVRLNVDPVFCWVYLNPSDSNGPPSVKDPKMKAKIDKGLMVVLGSFQVQNCVLASDASLTSRRLARPSDQPYIACGKTFPPKWDIGPVTQVPPPQTPAPTPSAAPPSGPQPANTRSLVDVVPTGSRSNNNVAPPKVITPYIAPITLSATIDTSAASFLTVPSYTARIIYPPGYAAIQLKVGSPGNQAPLDIYVQGLVTIQAPQIGNFLVQVMLLLLPQIPQQQELLQRALATDFSGDLFSKWGIQWMGVEG